MARLDEICSLNMGQSPDSSSYNEIGDGLPFFQGNADFGALHPNVRIWCNAPTKIAHSGDILISVRAPIGAMNIADRECCIGRGLAALTVDETLCNSRYLWYAIANKVNELNAKGIGSTFKAISKNVLGETEIPLPSLDKQHRISAILDKLSDLISLCKQQLAKLDELVKVRFVEMFGEPATNSMHWQESLLSDHLDIIGGYAFKSEGFTETGIPVLRIGNINSGHFLPVNMVYWQEDQSLQRYKMYPGDLVMSLTGTVGKDDYGNVCILGNDYVDTIHKNNEMLVILKNVMNDLYARDTSSNIKAVKRSSFQVGKYVGCDAPIGYLKSSEDKHVLVPDPETAPIVNVSSTSAAKDTATERLPQP